MENVYLLEIISRIEHELEEHNRKFAGSHIHCQCPERFRKVIDTLKKQVSANNERLRQKYIENETQDMLENRTVRGDELEPASLLYKLADQMEQVEGKKKQAEETRQEAQKLVASQLNEFDGFNR